MTRRFNKHQRALLYMRSNGVCAMCGTRLHVKKWHADHIKPVSKGGLTILENGQALCPTCNLKKGNKIMHKNSYFKQESEIRDLRPWQVEMYNKWHLLYHDRRQLKFFTLVATPGAGKTVAMLRLAYEEIRAQRATALIVVTPSEHLKTQWMEKAGDEFGISLTDDYEGYLGDEYHGAIFTYAAIADGRGSVRLVRELCDRYKVFVIFDEPHHMADGKSWGAGAIKAFERAIGGVLGSGTLFRSDFYKIPFCEYDSENRLRPHYEYNYGDGLRDLVVRPLYFRTLDADAHWVSRNGEIVKSKLSDVIDNNKESERYNTVISANNKFTSTIINTAYKQLTQIRTRQQPDAQMLVIVKDTKRIDAYARVIEKETGVKPVVVSSREDHGGSKEIAGFRNNPNQQIIVSIDMVSEGVDIPNLRVLVYLHNKKTRLFFMQATGRIVRTQEPCKCKGSDCHCDGKRFIDGSNPKRAGAFVYMPADDTLITYAEEIEKVRQYIINVEEEGEDIDDTAIVWDPPPVTENNYIPLGADGIAFDSVYGSERIDQSEIQSALEELETNLYPIPPELWVKIKRDLGVDSHYTQRVNIVEVQKSPHEIREELRLKTNKLAYRVALKLGLEPQEPHAMWMRRGNPSTAQSTIAQLENKLVWLEKILTDADI